MNSDLNTTAAANSTAPAAGDAIAFDTNATAFDTAALDTPVCAPAPPGTAIAYDVIVYGTIALDAIWRVSELPRPGGYAPILEERKMIGGEAANTAMALHRWGARVALVGNALGDDDDGRLLRGLFVLDAPDLDTRHIQTLPNARTPYCVCIATPDGERTMYGSGFDDWQCTPLAPFLARSAQWFTMDPNAWEPSRQAALAALDAGLRVVAMDYTRDPLLCDRATISVTSREHLCHLSTLDDLARYAVHLRDTHGPTAIITCGADGCFVAAQGASGAAVHIPAYPAPAMIDATGCGDVFRAGLLYGQIQSWDLLTTVRFASAAAALNCGGMGGWGGVRTVAEITALQAGG